MHIDITVNTPLLAEGVDGRMIPCRFVRLVSDTRAQIRITRTCHGYRKGELVTWETYHITPRALVKVRKYGTWIYFGSWTFPEY